MSEKKMYEPSFKKNAIGRLVPIHLIDAGLPQTSNLWKTVSGKCNKVKHNKTRHAYRLIFNWDIAEMHIAVKNMKHKQL